MSRAVVTGAASGIGRATALLLLERGAQVVAADRAVRFGQIDQQPFYLGRVGRQEIVLRMLQQAIIRF